MNDKEIVLTKEGLTKLEQELDDLKTVHRKEVNDRIRQEVTLYGMRADVDEELQRLGTHVAEVRRVLSAGGAWSRVASTRS